jgi:hypothetical protein
MSTMSYLDRFRAMADELRRMEHVEIVAFEPGKPLTKAELGKVEKVLGAALHESIKDFYGACNGLRLQWQIKPNVSPDAAKDLRRRSPDYYVKIAEYVGDPFANLHILPLADAMFGKRTVRPPPAINKGKTVHFAGEDLTPTEFAGRLRPFDLVNEASCMAFYCKPGVGDPPLLLLTEACSEWRRSLTTDFASYLEMLLATRVISEAREKLLTTDDDPPGAITGDARFWQAHTPELFGRAR